jgi:hypothetical protein
MDRQVLLGQGQALRRFREESRKRREVVFPENQYLLFILRLLQARKVEDAREDDGGDRLGEVRSVGARIQLALSRGASVATIRGLMINGHRSGTTSTGKGCDTLRSSDSLGPGRRVGVSASG